MNFCHISDHSHCFMKHFTRLFAVCGAFAGDTREGLCANQRTNEANVLPSKAARLTCSFRNLLLSFGCDDKLKWVSSGETHYTREVYKV